MNDQRASAPPRASLSFDVVIVGSGVAGCSVALRLERESSLDVAIVTKALLGDSTTRWAQGGIAVATGEDEESVELHLADTLRAGAGLCDEEATRILVEEGPLCVDELISTGAILDRAPDGSLALAREGGHSVARVVHAGGAATGAEVARCLSDALVDSSVTVLEGHFALDLCVENSRCVGIVALDPRGTELKIEARIVVLATGGAGQAFSVTTNPKEATGDGVAMALRAGVAVADVEFVQFHPTALATGAHPRPLLSEALRGHGALLVDGSGSRFVDELLSRDIVSRAIVSRMAEEQSDHLYLDVRPLDRFASRFPGLAKVLEHAGLDPSVDLVPVAPAAHYLSGGVLTDLVGASTLAGLYAVGEAACTGVQGANRLASNSLLEGLVFGRRAAGAILGEYDESRPSGALAALLSPKEPGPVPVEVLESRVSSRAPRTTSGPFLGLGLVQQTMTRGVGVIRTREGLEEALDILEALSTGPVTGSLTDSLELLNIVEFGRACAYSALSREESRGVHSRSDYPKTDDRFHLRLVHLRS